jgi:predicted phosphate transport protein (TIGR00153 family)
MLGWFRALLPKEEKFYDLFEQHAATLVAGAAAIQKLLHGEGSVPAQCAEIVTQEQRADDIAGEVMLAVRRTFITPFDRGDIKELISAMDDAIDQMQKTVKAITLFEVHAFEPPMGAMGDVIVQAAQRVADLIPLLRSMNQNSPTINEIAEEIGQIEARSDEIYDQGMKALFEAHRGGNTMAYIVGAEIYDHLEKVVDRFEDVAKCVSGIVIEHL